MKLPLLARISVIVALVLIVGGGVTAYLVYLSSTKALQDSISTDLRGYTAETMDKVDRFLYERMVDVQQLSGSVQVQHYLTQPTSRSEDNSTQLIKQFNEFQVLIGTWGDLSLVDTNRNIVLTTDKMKSIEELTKQLDFTRGYNRAVGGQSSYSDVIMDGSNGDSVMLFMSPVRDSQTSGQPIVGVLVGELAWPSTLEILKGIDNITTIINSKGMFLGDSQPNGQNQILVRDLHGALAFRATQKTQSGTAITPGLTDTKDPFVTAYSKESGYLDYKGNNWTMVAQTPRQIAFKPAQDLATKLIFTFLSLVLISMLVLILILEHLVLQPIGNLKEVITRLAKGDFSLRTSIVTQDELGDLGDGLNDMADKLQLAYQNLRESTKIAQNERRTLETTLEYLPVGVLVVGAPNGKPIMMNRVAEQITGQVAKSSLSKHTFEEAFEVTKEDGSIYPMAERPISIAMQTGRSALKSDTYIRRPNGEILAVRMVASPITLPDGTFQTVVSVFEDISNERNLEHSREEFFSIASHELRTPLTAIRGNTALIHDYFWNALPDPSLKEMINDIHDSSIRLIEIVNDFLDTSRLEQKRMNFNFENLNLVEVAMSVLKEYNATGSHPKILLKVIKPAQPLALVTADRNRTKQVLINLVGNALKFTEQGSVTVSFKLDSSAVRILVTDTGKGIAFEAQAHLFKKFEQAGMTVLTRDSVRGTGLGLYISKLIVEQMNGSIRLEVSQPGVGSTFSFSLPIAI